MFTTCFVAPSPFRASMRATRGRPACAARRVPTACTAEQSDEEAQQPASKAVSSPWSRPDGPAQERQSRSAPASLDVSGAIQSLMEIPSRSVFYTVLATWAVAALVVLSISSSILSSFDRFPLLPDLFRLIGLSYTCSFIWRYLVFEESRARLVEKCTSYIERIKF